MDLLHLSMFVLVGLGVGHIAHKVSEGAIPIGVAYGLGLAGALLGGIGATLAGMTFYNLAGRMVVGLGCATVLVLLWRQFRLL